MDQRVSRGSNGFKGRVGRGEQEVGENKGDQEGRVTRGQ